MQDSQQAPNEQTLTPTASQMDDLNQEMDSLLYALSHDLRAPLRAIDGFSAALAEDYEQSLAPEAKDYLARIRAAAKRLETYLDALLRASRESRGEIQLEEVDLSALVQTLASAKTSDLAPEAPQREVLWVIAPGLTAWTDLALMRTALAKLVDNAWKFTAKTAQARIEFGCRLENSHKVFFLSDNGPGLNMSYAKPRLFGMFQRLHDDPDLPGLGTGLATARRIVNRLGGRIRGFGQPGQGACFEIVLPEAGTREGA